MLNIFLYVYLQPVYSFQWVCLHIFYSYSNWIVYFLTYFSVEFWVFVHTSDASSSLDMWFANIFSWWELFSFSYKGPWGFPDDSDGKESVSNAGRPGFDPWAGKIPWRGKPQPTPVFWPGELHGQVLLHGGAWQATVYGVAKSQTRLSD